MSSQALDDIRVVEFSTMVAGPYCGKLLGDLGAEVVKVEPPGGDSARQAGPFPDEARNPEQSALFLYLNTSKRGMVLDLASPEGLDTFRDLVRWADVLIDNQPRGTLEGLGLSWPELETLNPGLVYTAITPYGLTGPRADAAGDELTLVHAGGLGNLLPTRSLDTKRAPIKPGGYFVGYHGALAAAVATLGAIHARKKTGRGQCVDISLQEAVLGMVAPTVTSPRYHKTNWCRVPDRPPALGRMQTRDGYVILSVMDDHHFVALRELMGNPEWCAGKEWENMAYRSHHMMDIAPQLEAWMREQSKDEVHHAGAKQGIAIGPVNTVAEVMENQQYAARGYFVEVDHPVAGKHKYSGWPYRMTATPPRVTRPAPQLDEDRDAILELIKPDSGGTPAPAGNGRKLPLEGVRVLELCWVWAGPYACMLLAKLGAEVIKVEGHTRPDIMRRSIVWPLYEPEPVSVPPSQGMSFNTVNMNKKDVTLDLSKKAGQDLARKLAAICDIVVDNMRPGALAKLGLGYEDFKQIDPSLIVASSSGRGYDGPETQYLGYAPIHHGIGGATSITGYPDDPPCHTLGDVDIMNATATAYAILAALHHRDRTGEGQFIDYSQCEGVTSLMGEALLGYAMTGEVPERQGNAHPVYAPHNVYPAWGVDRWVALEVHSDDEFVRLAELLGQPELATDARFAEMASRKENEAELDEIISAWMSERDRDWMVNTFMAAGLAVAPSRNWQDLYADRHLRARDVFERVEHPELGELELVGPPWKMSGHEQTPTCAPRMGEHNDYVFMELLGLSEAEVAALREDGVIA